MIHNYRHRRDMYRVTVNVDPEKTQALIDAAVALGIGRVFIVRARGVLHKRKWGPFTLPAISPSFDILNLFVPEAVLQALLQTLVKVGRLDHFGAGSIYASRITDLWAQGTTIAKDLEPVTADFGYEFSNDLMAIQCICQLEHAEEIAEAAMQAGSPSPTICYGSGHGIRDRLGPFLQLTINPKKEVLELVVGSAEAERVFETMVDAGRLDKPAQGYISTWPVETGLINTVSYQQTTPYPATIEQIIKAIDQLQGNTNWRSTGTLLAATGHRKKLRGLVSLNCIVNRGFGDRCSMVAMEAGATGTSTYHANALPIERPARHAYDHSDEREILSLTVARDLVAPIVEALAALDDLQGTPVVLFTYPAPQAVTYLGESAATAAG